MHEVAPRSGDFLCQPGVKVLDWSHLPSDFRRFYMRLRRDASTFNPGFAETAVPERDYS